MYILQEKKIPLFPFVFINIGSFRYSLEPFGYLSTRI